MIINGICIFICDDTRDQEVFAKAVNYVSPETICFAARNPYDALYMMTEEKVMPTFIVAELDSPEMDAIAFLKAMKGIEALKNIPVIVHSTSPQPQKIIELKESGATAIYFRPYEFHSVCNMLNLYLDPEMAILNQN
jgi:response regulator RpfG family c-di-GMP phosphodiesterase